ncbi:CDP-glycerol glycerophosphotransferase family protein [Streptomyces sp. NPDC005202]|uniref:CDP-glycerol glycerophosphotransferase family protein n=1 Tax=Streptomyces sp. NPDC005202 TaxID=3157021 RepID=UPI0033A24C8D
MPELSVVVHGPDAHGQLAGLLDSLAAHPLPDTEVVVAAVGDRARDTAERRAPAAVVLPLPEGTSAAAARAAGADRASGRWLHFVHAQDGLPASAPRAVAGRAAHLPDTVDILLFDHVRSTRQTPWTPSADGPLLARAGHGEHSLDAVAHLLRLTPLLGNRALRTNFWRAHAADLDTDDEAYAAYAALLRAGRVACLYHVGYEDRRPRPDSPRPVTPEDRYALVDRYERLLALAAGRPAPHTVLHDVMVRDVLRTFVRAGLPNAVAREFFRRASRAAVRWRPEDHHRPAGLDGVRHAVLEGGAYVGYRALQAAHRARRAATSATGTARRRAAATLRDHCYRRALDRPVDPDLAVFSAYWNRGVACNPAAIAAKLAELAPHVHPVWVVSADRAARLPPGTDHVVPGTRRYGEVLASAKYLVSNVNFPDTVVKRPDAVHLQTHHGTPLKRMGVDQMPYPAAARGMDFAALLARVKWDYSLSANSHSTRVWERAYPSRFVSLDYGYPRNDVFYTATAAGVGAVRERLGIRPGTRAILYAPTHRDYQTGWAPRLDLAALADRLGKDTVLLVRGHYFHDRSASPLADLPRTGGRVVDVTSHARVEELCLAADALVTDYSSLMFDYANLDRPIVVHADDWETYATARGVYFDLLAEAPGPVARTQEELAEIFTFGAWRDGAAAKARAVFRRRFCEYDDGHAAERVVRRLFLGESEESLPPVLPLDARTPAPSPEEAYGW